MLAHTICDGLHEFRPSVAYKQFSVSLPERKMRGFQVQTKLYKTDLAIIDIPIHALFRVD